MSDIQSDIAALKPARAERIMDLVEAAGIDVSPWGFKQNREPVSEPSANPNYCYEWAFGGNGQPIALCVWQESIKESEGQIVFRDSLRQHAMKLEAVTFDRFTPAKVKSRSRDQAKRARKFDLLVQEAFRKVLPVRIVLLVGKARTPEGLGLDTAKVKFRSLDPAWWYVHGYSDVDGSFSLVREVPVPLVADAASPSPQYVDQFELPEAQDKIQTSGSTYPRSADVRQKALARAAGVCEFCKTPGFQMKNGAIYLETHHVVPLSENGPDVIWNVVALCPNDHRRAHFAAERAEIRTSLIGYLVKHYPAATQALAGLHTQVAETAM